MILIFKSANPAWQIKKKKIRRGIWRGAIAGRKEKEMNWSFWTQKDRKLREKEGIMSEMQCSTSLEHTVTIQFTGHTGSQYF